MERVGVAAPAADFPEAVRRLGGMKTGFSGGPDRAGSVDAMRWQRAVRWALQQKGDGIWNWNVAMSWTVLSCVDFNPNLLHNTELKCIVWHVNK